MEIGLTENKEIYLKKVYLGVLFISDDGEELGVCMRDSGFEIAVTHPDTGLVRVFEIKKGLMAELISNKQDATEEYTCGDSNNYA